MKRLISALILSLFFSGCGLNIEGFHYSKTDGDHGINVGKFEVTDQ